jgi:hypothetical protein
VEGDHVVALKAAAGLEDLWGDAVHGVELEPIEGLVRVLGKVEGEGHGIVIGRNDAGIALLAGGLGWGPGAVGFCARTLPEAIHKDKKPMIRQTENKSRHFIDEKYQIWYLQSNETLTPR